MRKVYGTTAALVSYTHKIISEGVGGESFCDVIQNLRVYTQQK